MPGVGASPVLADTSHAVSIASSTAGIRDGRPIGSGASPAKGTTRLRPRDRRRVTAGPGVIRVLLADDQPLIRAGLVMVITDAPDISGWAGPTC